MNTEKLKDLQINPADKRRPQRAFWSIVIVVVVVLLATVSFIKPWAKDKREIVNNDTASASNSVSANTAASQSTGETTTPKNSPVAAGNDRTALTVSGYIINRERIELSPRFLGVVKWIGVKKGDAVTNGQVVVLLDDAEYRARLNEAEGRVANAQVAVAKGELDYERIQQLAKTHVESKQREDDVRLQLDAARAALREAEGVAELARTYVEWCTIRSPINGVVVEKLVNPNELVMPQSFGGGRGPSTALLAMADPKDLQVEIDMNESDLAKVSLGQKCRVSPEAYPDKNYTGTVAEIAPEANRAKGTLQIKVQIHNPDKFLTPELSAKVEFLKAD
ncbi:MAG TPA: efflux RND transporter periplasmic adaptor subunit [Verrucomicrobiae bacterium]|nr:efflux RND transporter periplasmic adaptor subunit [Verrucomicrobiae bacterium]